MAENLGHSPQSWIEHLLRYIRDWTKMGDLMTEGLDAGFWSIHAHGRRGLRSRLVPLLSPGADLWPYGFNPGDIPMEYGKLNKGACRNLGQYG